MTPSCHSASELSFIENYQRLACKRQEELDAQVVDRRILVGSMQDAFHLFGLEWLGLLLEAKQLLTHATSMLQGLKTVLCICMEVLAYASNGLMGGSHFRQ